MAVEISSSKFNIEAVTQTAHDLYPDGFPPEHEHNRLLRRLDVLCYLPESHVSTEFPMSISSAFYGNEITQIYSYAQKMMKRIADHKKARGEPFEPGQMTDLTKTSGFDVLYHMPTTITPHDYLVMQQYIAQNLITDAFNNFNAVWQQKDAPLATPETVGVFAVITSDPPAKGYAEEIARAAGIDGTKTKIVTHVEACDSTGSFMFDVSSGKYNEYLPEGKTVAVYGFEGMTRNILGGTDGYSPQLFSTASFGMVYDPQALQMIGSGVEKTIEEGADCLQAKYPYKPWDDGMEITKRARFLTEPKNGSSFWMNPEKVTLYFAKNVYGVIKETLAQAAGMTEPLTINNVEHIIPVLEEITRIVPHHASRAMVDLIRNQLKDLIMGKERIDGRMSRLSLSEEDAAGRKLIADSLDQKMPFVIHEGNAPACTMPIALGRQLADIHENDTIMLVTYGAGGGFHSQLTRVVNPYRAAT